MKNRNRLQGFVIKGDQHGRSIGYPTINLDPILWPTELQPGVYASNVTINEKQYLGALYYGPRSIKGETKNVLEITLLDFSDTIYGEVVSVLIGDFVRSPIVYQPGKHHESALQKQIADDVKKIKLITADWGGSFRTIDRSGF